MRAMSLVLVVGYLAFGATLQCSDFAPRPGDVVTLTVVGAPSGATFRWDLDGDGRFEATSAEPHASFVAPAGLRLVQVEVVAGQGTEILAAAVVGHPYLGAVRTILVEDATLLVQITVESKVPVIAPGLEEEIPRDWALEVVAEGGAFWRRAERLEVLWPLILEPGTTISFSYRLHPPAGVAVRLSGLVSGYVEGKRAVAPVAGFFQP